MAATTKRLQDLHDKAAAAGQWPLSAACSVALGDEGNLDHRINVVGAMHELGLLRNRLAPFWQSWREDEAAWAARCVARLMKGSDRDYWAVAALLGTSIRSVAGVVAEAGYSVLSVRSCPQFDKPNLHIAVYSLVDAEDDVGEDEEPVWAPVLEIGWDSSSGEIMDMARWRAVLMDQVSKVGDNFLGEGSGTHFVRAALPHGSWRVADAEFKLLPEAAVPREETLLG